MGIFYAMVARGYVVLAEFSSPLHTNAGGVARQVLDKISATGNNDSNSSYSHDRYIFHVKKTDGLTVLCMADESFGRRVPFAFMEDVNQRFVSTYGRAIRSSPAYAMNEEFSRVLNQQMNHYSNDTNADRINRLKGEMSQIKSVLKENIDKVLDRGDRLAILVEKTAAIQGNALRFKSQSRRHKDTTWWNKVKLTALAVAMLVITLFTALALF